MPKRNFSIRGMSQSWGKTYKGFAEYLQLAGKSIGKRAADSLAAAGAEFLANEDWDWPRGKRFDAVYNGRNVRASGPYASGFRGGDAMHPWYSGNLHDSMAVGVYNNTRLLSANYMTPGAAEPQTYKGQTVDGVSAGQEALLRAGHVFAPGSSGATLRAVLVVGVPYAEDVNNLSGHAGYVDYFEEEFSSTIRPEIERLRKIKLRMK